MKETDHEKASEFSWKNREKGRGGGFPARAGGEEAMRRPEKKRWIAAKAGQGEGEVLLEGHTERILGLGNKMGENVKI